MPQIKNSSAHKTVLLEVHAGLCNRLRALVSGICLTEDLHRSLLVYWPTSQADCRAGFSDLYETPSLPPWVSILTHLPPLGRVECQSQKEALKIIADGKIIRSCRYFHSSDVVRRQRYLQQLLPKQILLRQVARNFQHHPRHLTPIGVHVRRTDNKKSIDQSPLFCFEAAMQAIPRGYFYVVSDDAPSVRALTDKFPGRVYCHETLRNRSTVSGMQEAVVSLYTLALCTRILGSYHSTFSTTAGELKRTIVETIQKKSERPCPSSSK